jgi:hypothetical protein
MCKNVRSERANKALNDRMIQFRVEIQGAGPAYYPLLRQKDGRKAKFPRKG